MKSPSKAFKAGYRDRMMGKPFKQVGNDRERQDYNKGFSVALDHKNLYLGKATSDIGYYCSLAGMTITEIPEFIKPRDRKDFEGGFAAAELMKDLLGT